VPSADWWLACLTSCFAAQAGEAGELEREELLVDPDVAAVTAFGVVAEAEVEGVAAGVADGGVGVGEWFAADVAGGLHGSLTQDPPPEARERGNAAVLHSCVSRQSDDGSFEASSLRSWYECLTMSGKGRGSRAGRGGAEQARTPTVGEAGSRRSSFERASGRAGRRRLLFGMLCLVVFADLAAG
jgi:hypothetical protein